MSFNCTQFVVITSSSYSVDRTSFAYPIIASTVGFLFYALRLTVTEGKPSGDRNLLIRAILEAIEGSC